MHSVNDLASATRPLSKNRMAVDHGATIRTILFDRNNNIDTTGKIIYTPDLDNWSGANYLFVAQNDDRIKFISSNQDENWVHAFRYVAD